MVKGDFMSGYRWKRFVKSDLKMPEVPEGKIIITTDSTGHRRVLLGAANVRRYFGKNTLWVELYHDREERAIGFKPTPKKNERRIQDAFIRDTDLWN